MRRRFVIRLALAAGSMALFCLMVVVGVGCAVRAGVPGLQNALGERRFARVAVAYERAMAGLLPKDRDGDGVCDGREVFLRHDPDNPRDYPYLSTASDDDGIGVFFWGKLQPDGGLGNSEERNGAEPWVEPGRRLRLQGFLRGWERRISAPAGFQLRLIAPTPAPAPAPRVMMALPGGSLTAGDLVVPVATDGGIAIEVEIVATPQGEVISDNRPNPIEIVAVNARTGDRVGAFWVVRAWALPPIIPTVNSYPTPGRDMDLIVLQWPAPAVPASAHDILVEVARDQEGAQWFPVFTFLRDVTPASCAIWRQVAPYWHPYDGPVKYRVVPVRYSPTAD